MIVANVLYTEPGDRKNLYCTECKKYMYCRWHTDGHKVYKRNANGTWEAHELRVRQLTKMYKETFEESFNRNSYLSQEEVTLLVGITGMTEKQVKKWFKNIQERKVLLPLVMYSMQINLLMHAEFKK
jgi:hypothetical protein